MRTRPTPHAKLSRPRLHDALPRARLFARLDALRRHALVWVSGPPGAGKTTLAASYMDARDLPGLWYQVDSGDLDLSTFFFYLAEAAKPIAPGQSLLPLLSQDYLHDLPGFARRWWRQLFARLTAPHLLVFDNYQDAADSEFDAVLAAAIPDVPDGVTIMVISRSAPPPAFARALAHGEVAVLGWDELRMSIEEASAVAAAKGVSAPETVSAVLSQCEGWAAGLTLLLERVRQAGALAPGGGHDSMDTLFGYFAGLVFDALPEGAQRCLLLCGYAPSLSATQAEALTGDPEASRLLERLYRRQLFTNRLAGPDPVYEFHALFRAFLRARALQMLAPEVRAGALQRAAGLLLAAGRTADAVGLYAEIEDWGAIERAVESRAPALVAEGRGQTLRDWIELLPSQRLERAPWVRFWLGTALLAHDQQRSRATLTRAYEQMCETDNFAGQVAASAGVVDTYFFSFSGYAGLKEWTDTIAQLLAQPARFSSAEQRLQACTGYLLAAFFGDGTHPDIAPYVQEIRRLVRSPLPPHLRLRAGTILVAYAGAILHPGLVREDLDLIDGLAAEPAVAPLRQAQWQQRYGYLCYQLGEFAQAQARLAHAHRLCKEHGLRSPMSLINQVSVYVMVAQRDGAGAMRTLDRWAQMLTPDRPVERTQWNVARLVALAHEAVREEDWPALAREIAAQMDATGQTWIRLANRIPGAYALAECGHVDAARHWVADLRAIMTGTCFDRFERDALLIEAALALRERQSALARERLGRALRLTAEAGIPLQCAHSPRVLTQLLEFAAHENIEAELARSLAARYGLPLEPPHPEIRSWPVRLLTLGAFVLERQGGPLASKGKLQQRPLGVLKLLAAHGRRAVPLSAVAEALWPDSDGDRAANALKVALHRLRSLLDCDSAVVVEHGALHLARGSCWTDVMAFEELVEHAERHRAAGELDAFESAAQAALALYRGPFLPAEEPSPWVMAARDRLAQQARQLVLALGTRLESTARAAHACTLYEAGLMIDSLSEPLYQGLMRAQLSLGQSAEAMQAYRRCREMLSVVLGIAPSAESMALFRRAQAQAQAVDHP